VSRFMFGVMVGVKSDALLSHALCYPLCQESCLLGRNNGMGGFRKNLVTFRESKKSASLR